jgi:hypothetical protein
MQRTRELQTRAEGYRRSGVWCVVELEAAEAERSRRIRGEEERHSHSFASFTRCVQIKLVN